MKKFLKLFSLKPAKVNKTEDEKQKWESSTTCMWTTKKIKETEGKINLKKKMEKPEQDIVY